MAANDTPSDTAERRFVDAALRPLDDTPSGEDLSYDPTYLELSLAATGRPETQFSAAEPPAWPEVRRLAEELLARTRDLRVGTLWLRAAIAQQGLLGLPEGLRLLAGWLDARWDDVHPALDPDDGDAFERIAALGVLVDLKGLLGELRNLPLAFDRRLGGMRVRDVEVALDRLPPRPDDDVYTLAQIEGQLADLPQLAAQLHAACRESLEQVAALQKTMNSRVGAEEAVDLKPLRAMLEAVQGVLPDPSAAAAGAEAGDEGGADDAAEPGASASAAPAGAVRRPSGPGVIASRQDAVKAIQAVCAYLEKSEPTNPAQLLLRRAERLIGKNFLQLVHDFAPDAMNEVARIMGVDPETITSENGS